MFFATPCWGEIIQDPNGNRFITIGSTKDEVLEILGTPRKIDNYLNWWYYDYEHLSFDQYDRIKEYTDAKNLKILLLPSSKKIKNKDASSNSTSNILSSSSLTTSSSSSNSSYIPVRSGYGELSEKTGRAKTVSVKGYTRKDGTYVQPHYRSPPKRK